jgi:hypothetical protein
MNELLAPRLAVPLCDFILQVGVYFLGCSPFKVDQEPPFGVVLQERKDTFPKGLEAVSDNVLSNDHVETVSIQCLVSKRRELCKNFF